MRTTHSAPKARRRARPLSSSPSETAPSGERFDAFICYKRIPEDEQFVDHLSQALIKREPPRTVWVDRARIEPAVDWLDRVTRAIDASRALIYVITPESTASEDCRQELDLAAARNKLIIPVLLRDVPDRSVLHPRVSRLNWIPADPGGDPGRAVAAVAQALDDDLDWRDEHTYLGARAAQWNGQQRKRGFLLHGEELGIAETWLGQAPAHTAVPPTQLHLDYIAASRRDANQVRNHWIEVLSASLVIALVLAGVAFIQWQHARTDAQVANARALAAESSADLSSNPQQSLSLALDGMRLNTGGPEVQALRLALAQDRLRMVIKTGTGESTRAAWNGRLGQLAVTAPHDSVALWDTMTGRLTQTLPTGHAVNQILYDASGTQLAAVSSAGYVSMWTISAAGHAASIDTRPLDEEISAETQPADRSAPGPLISGSWTAGNRGQFDVLGSGLSDLIAYSPATGSVRNVAGVQGLPVSDSVPSPDRGELLLSGLEDDLLNLATGQVTSLNAYAAADAQACWFADGSAVFVSGDTGINGTQTLFSRTGRVIAQLPENQEPTSAVACSASASDKWAAAGDQVGEVYLRLAQGAVLTLTGDDDTISAMTSSPDGRYLATASADGTARIWNATNGQPVTVLTGDGAPLTDVQFGSDDGLVLTVDQSGFVRTWDSGLGEPEITLQRPARGQALPSGFAADGTLVTGAGLITSSGADAKVTQVSALTWDARTGRLLRQVPLAGITAAAVPCSSALQTWARGLAAQMLPASDCSLPPPPGLVVEAVVSRPEASGGPVMELLPVAVSPDGSRVAYARHDEVDVLDAAGHRVARLRVNGTPDGLSFYNADAAIMVMTAKAIYLWRPLSAQPLVIPQPSQPTDATVSGGFLAAADGGQTVGVWSASTGKLVRSLTPPATPPPPDTPAVPLRVAITGNGAVIAAGSDDGSICLWDIATGRLIAHDPSAGYVEELTTTPAGDLLAVDWPNIGAHGPFPPVSGEVLAGSTGRVLATYTANQAQPSISPGAALSPDGGFILAGADGIAPTPPGGLDAAYQVSSGQMMTGLQAAVQPALYSYAESSASPWSPDGTRVLIGTAIYACDACGSPTALQAAAASRLAWSKPLSASADHPPATSPYA